MDNFLNEFGDRARRKRQELGLTLEEVAKKMGYNSRTAVLNIEQGMVDIPQSRIISLAKALETTPAYLMGWEENPDDELTYDNSKPEILVLYESLPKKLQEKALAYVRAMADTYNEIKYSLNENGGIA
jgi:transcriptional regulator with XRE-family HTH domain